MINTQRHTHYLQKAGIFLSFLCLIHCIATPILLISLPYLSNSLLDHRYEGIIVGVSVLLAVFVQSNDYKTHKSMLPISIMIVSILFYTYGIGFASEYAETYVNSFASILMAGSFILNWNLHRKMCTNHSH
ncbi:MAG: MerC domain-containing protein [Leadbetterella sp.]